MTGAASRVPVFCTRGSKHSAGAITDRVVHNAVWVDDGTHNLREQAILSR